MAIDIKHKTIRGVKWTAVFTMYQFISGPIYKVILAQLFSRVQYAYLGIILLFVSFTNLVNNIGVVESIIKKQDVTNEQLSSLFFLNIFMSGLAGLVIFIFAPQIESFYNYQNLASLIRLLSIAVFLNGFPKIFRVTLQKELHFKELIILRFIRDFLDSASSVVFILLGLGVAGFIYGTIFSTVVFTILVYITAARKNKLKISFHFSLKEVKPFLKFGIFISLDQILTFVASRIDEVLIGKYKEKSDFGLYFFAKDLLNKPLTLISQTFSQVLFAAFSKIQYQLNRLRRAYNKVTHIISLTAFPIFMGFFMVSSYLVPLIFGVKWQDSVDIIKFFCMISLVRVLTKDITTSLLYSKNKPAIIFYIDLAVNGLYFCGLLIISIFTTLTVPAILSLYAMNMITKTVVLQFIANRALQNSMFSYLSNIKDALMGSLVMMASMFLVGYFVLKFGNLLNFFISTAVGGAVYLTGIYILRRESIIEIVSFFKTKKLNIN